MKRAHSPTPSSSELQPDAPDTAVPVPTVTTTTTTTTTSMSATQPQQQQQQQDQQLPRQTERASKRPRLDSYTPDTLPPPFELPNPRYVRGFRDVDFRRPVEVDYFSLPGLGADPLYDRSQLESLLPDKNIAVGKSLREGYDQYEEIPSDALIDHVLTSLDRHASSGGAKPLVASWRHNLSKIMMAPNKFMDPWEIGVCRVDGVLFLDVRECDEKLEEEANRDERNKEMCYWGYKFEQIMTSEDTSGVVDRHQVFISFVETKIDGMRLFFGCEIDAALPNAKSFPADYAELKTNRSLHDNRSWSSFCRYKTLSTWCQCFLAGVDNTIIGCRNNDGDIESIEVFSTAQLAHNKEGWEPGLCLAVLSDFLRWLDGNVAEGESRLLRKDARSATVFLGPHDEAQAFVDPAWRFGGSAGESA